MKVSLQPRMSQAHGVPMLGYYSNQGQQILWMRYIDIWNDDTYSPNFYQQQISNIKFYESGNKAVALYSAFNAIIRLIPNQGFVFKVVFYTQSSIFPEPTISFNYNLAVDSGGSFAITGAVYSDRSTNSWLSSYKFQLRCFDINTNLLAHWERVGYGPVPPIAYNQAVFSYQLLTNINRWSGSSDYAGFGSTKFFAPSCNSQFDVIEINMNGVTYQPFLDNNGQSILQSAPITMSILDEYIGTCISNEWIVMSQYIYSYLGSHIQEFGFFVWYQNSFQYNLKHMSVPDSPSCLSTYLYYQSGLATFSMVYQTQTFQPSSNSSTLYLLLVQNVVTATPTYTLYQLQNESPSPTYYGYYANTAIFASDPLKFYFGGQQNIGSAQNYGLLNYVDLTQTCSNPNPAFTFTSPGVTFLDEGHFHDSGSSGYGYFTQVVYASTLTNIAYTGSDVSIILPSSTLTTLCSLPGVIKIQRTDGIISVSAVLAPIGSETTLHSIAFDTSPNTCSDATFKFTFQNSGSIIDPTTIGILQYQPTIHQFYFTMTPISAQISATYSLTVTIAIAEFPSISYTSPAVVVNVVAPTILPPSPSAVMFTAYPNCQISQNLGQYTVFPSTTTIFPMTFVIVVNGVTNPSEFTLTETLNDVTVIATPTAQAGQVYNGVIQTYLTQIPTITDSTVTFSMTIVNPTLNIPSNPVSPITATPYCSTTYTVSGFSLTPSCSSSLSYELIFNGTLSSSFNPSLILITIASSSGSLVLNLNPPVELLYSTTIVQVKITASDIPSLSSTSFTFSLVVGVPPSASFTAPESKILSNYIQLSPNMVYSYNIGSYSIIPACLKPYLKYEFIFNDSAVNTNNFGTYQATIWEDAHKVVQGSITTPNVLSNQFYNVSVNCYVDGMPDIHDNSYKMSIEYISYCLNSTFTKIPVIKDQVYVLGSSPMTIEYDNFVIDPSLCAANVDYHITVDFSSRVHSFISFQKELNQISVQTSNVYNLGQYYVQIVADIAELSIQRSAGFYLNISRISANKTFPQLLTQYYNNNTYTLTDYNSTMKLSELDSVILIAPYPSFVTFSNGVLTFNLKDVSPMKANFTLNIMYNGTSQNFFISISVISSHVEVIMKNQSTTNQTSSEILATTLVGFIKSISHKGLLKLNFNYPLKNSTTNWTSDDMLILHQKYGEEEKLRVNYSLSSLSEFMVEIQLFFKDPETVSMRQVNTQSNFSQVKDTLWVVFANQAQLYTLNFQKYVGNLRNREFLVGLVQVVMLSFQKTILYQDQFLHKNGSDVIFQYEFSRKRIIDNRIICGSSEGCNDYSSDLHLGPERGLVIIFAYPKQYLLFFAIALQNAKFLLTYHTHASLLIKLAMSAKFSEFPNEQSLSVLDLVLAECGEFHIQSRLE